MYMRSGKKLLREVMAMSRQLRAHDGGKSDIYDHKSDGVWRSETKVSGTDVHVIGRAFCSRCNADHVHAGVV